MEKLTEATKARLKAARAADPSRWTRNGGNENGPRELQVDGWDVSMGGAPGEDRTYWYAWDAQGRLADEGEFTTSGWPRGTEIPGATA